MKPVTATPGAARHVFPHLFIEAAPPRGQRDFDSSDLFLGKILGIRFFFFSNSEYVSKWANGKGSEPN